VIDKEKKLGYGCGWFIDESNGLRYIYHSGSNRGFRTFSFTIPDKNYLVLIFSNRTDIDLEEIVLKINQILGSTDKPFTKIEVLTS
jgi:D-alanyl-D-alanine carboxypeptidase